MVSGCSGGTDPVVIEGGEETVMTEAEEETYEAETSSNAADESQN